MNNKSFYVGLFFGILIVIVLKYLYNYVLINYNSEQLNLEISKCIEKYPNDEFARMLGVGVRNKNINTYIKQLNYSCYKLEFIKENCLNTKN